ncbi:MAG: hypothetical protein DI626_05175 [Micavibrio aeruginosavorus]|uniref:Polysaccharide synthesis protein exod n=1 Tax=Micavibrio aeruginosavorus TaxID=349221 RepID=A0A2W5BV20_9BACT|nr:MAG: hypothetical protein DI626_05175 [Micavibrio aeruginosavorus]
MENSHETPRALSDLLTELKNRFEGQDVRMSDILEGFHERGFGFFLLLMGLFCIIPIPTFGLKSLVCLPMGLLTLQQALGFHTLWMPDIIRRKVVRKDIFEAFMDHAFKWTAKLETIAKPRYAHMTQGIFSYLIGITGTLMVACIIMPLPLTNTVPAIGVILMSVGVLVRDGLAVLIGMIVGTLWSLAWFAAFFYLGAKGLEMMIPAVMTAFQ